MINRIAFSTSSHLSLGWDKGLKITMTPQLCSSLYINSPQSLPTHPDLKASDSSSCIWIMHKAISTRPWQCDIEINDAQAQGQIVLQLTGSSDGYIILPAVDCFSWCHCQVAGLIHPETEVTVTFLSVLADFRERMGWTTLGSASLAFICLFMHGVLFWG